MSNEMLELIIIAKLMSGDRAHEPGNNWEPFQERTTGPAGFIWYFLSFLGFRKVFKRLTKSG